jgi:16S rRNA (guanine1207-N2)-methyltransferase
MKQYFENTPDLKDEEKTLQYPLNGELLHFATNSGLFAKDHIDEYSIKLIENIPDDNYQHILDLGCGYGFIGIILAKRYPQAEVTLSDVTERAIDYANINIERNNLKNAQTTLDDGINGGNYDLITLNPPIHAGKKVCYNLYEQAIEHLTDNGRFYIVINKKHGAKSTISFLEQKTQNVAIIYKKKGLFIIEVKK